MNEAPPSTPFFARSTLACANRRASDVSFSTQRRLPMRAPVLFALHLAFPAALLAQGWIIPASTDSTARVLRPVRRAASRARAHLEQRARDARRPRAPLRSGRDISQSRRNRAGGRLHVSAPRRRRVSGAAALDQRAARERRDHGCGARSLYVRGDRAPSARSRARRVDGLRTAARAHLSDQSG